MRPGWRNMQPWPCFLPLSCLSLLMIPLSAATASEHCEMLANHTIRWIVPSKPGGGYDAYSRLLQPFLQQQLAAQILIENRPDAGGIVGALAIRNARADGFTIGIIDASGLLAASMTNGGKALHPPTDFTIIGRLATNRMVLLTGRKSGLKTVEDVLRASSSRTLLVGARDVGSASFIAIPVMAALLDLHYALVSGYVGSPTRALAAIRGEIDLIIQDSGSIRHFVDDGELVPLLQITRHEAVVSNDNPPGWMANLPVLEDLAVLRAKHSGLNQGAARQMARALSDIIEAGRLVVAPVGMTEPTTTCLVSALSAVLNSTPLLEAAAKAGVDIEPAGPDIARKDLMAGSRALEQISVLVKSAIEQARQ